jgi:hypothetical protein
METLSTKVPVVIRPDYVMYLEDFNQMLWFHTDIARWTKEIKTKYLEDLNLLQYLTGVPLMAAVEQENNKLKKFGHTLNFTHVDTTTGKDGKTYNIFSRSL